jgi:nucleotide-binding universal stress UspA family protein
MKIDRMRIPLDGSALAEVGLEAALDLSRGEPYTLVLLHAAEAHTLPGADPAAEQVAVVREAESYLAAIADGLAKRGIEGVETGV